MVRDTMKARYLSLHPLLLWQHIERPIDWPRHFGRVAPLEVEIGFGNGEFLLREAQQHPDWNLVGIELAWASVQRGLRKIAQTCTPNVRLLLVEAGPGQTLTSFARRTKAVRHGASQVLPLLDASDSVEAARARLV